MNLYIVLYLILVLLLLFEITKKNRLFSYSFFFMFITLLLFLGTIRWKTGTDWDSYKNFFETNNTWHDFVYNGYAYEIGYIGLNYIVKQIFNNYSFFLFITTFINLFCFVSIATYFFKERLLFSLFLYFCVYLGGIFVTRQLLAVSICVLSIRYVYKRELIKFLALVAIASCFHVTALVFAISYFIYNKRISIKQFTILFLIVIGISIFIPLLLNYIYTIIPNERIATKILIYTSGQRPLEIDSLLKGIGKRIVTFSLFFYIRDKYKLHSDAYSGFLNIYLFGTLSYYLFAFSDFRDFIRISAYFQLLEIWLLYYSYMKSKNGNILLLILFFGLMKLYSSLSGYYDLYVPFYTIFENVPRVMY